MRNWQQRTAQRRQAERNKHRLALHESAHSVCCYVRNMRIKKIMVGRGINDEYDDLQMRGWCGWEVDKLEPRDLLVVTLAGPASDRFFGYGEPDSRSRDFADAKRCAEQIGGDIDAVMAMGRRDAELLIRQYSSQIQQLAITLLSTRWMELSGEEVERFLAQAGVMRQRQIMGFEHRSGVIRPVPASRVDPGRITAVHERRCDGYIA